MTEVVVIVGIGGLALYLWHRFHQSQQQPIPPYYYGAPAWPTMNPQIVPEVGMPPGTQAAATYYGVQSSTLEPFLK